MILCGSSYIVFQLWKKEPQNDRVHQQGYTFEYRFEPYQDPTIADEAIVIVAMDKSGKYVGHAEILLHNNGYLSPNDVEVKPEHRRKGIASALYQYAEQITDLKLKPHSVQSSDGESLWFGEEADEWGIPSS